MRTRNFRFISTFGEIFYYFIYLIFYFTVTEEWKKIEILVAKKFRIHAKGGIDELARILDKTS